MSDEHDLDFPRHIPSLKRIAEAHTKMTTRDMQAWSQGREGAGHRIYTQSTDEACYLCALLWHAQQLQSQNEALRKALKPMADATAFYIERADEYRAHVEFRVGDLRKAYALLTPAPERNERK